MILDSKGKLFGKISIVDILIVVIVLAAAGGVGYKLTRSKVGIYSTFAKSDKIEISFYADEVPDYAANAVSNGDIAKDFDRNVSFGKVTGKTTGNSVSWGVNEKGEQVASTKKGFNSVKVTVEGEGIYRDGKASSGVSFGSADFYIGRQITLLVGNSAFQCRIYDIKKKG
ncbi:MAG: DUF4330 domain-containing protein [Bacillota bacterium]|nr:DUF4330 domain-containing protein [Bacillota bacterium]